MRVSDNANDYRGHIDRNTPARQTIATNSRSFFINHSDTLYIQLDGRGEPEHLVFPNHQAPSAILQPYYELARTRWISTTVVHVTILTAFGLASHHFQLGWGLMVLVTILTLASYGLYFLLQDWIYHEPPKFTIHLPAKDHAQFFHHATSEDIAAVRQLLTRLQARGLSDDTLISIEKQLQEILTRYTHHHLDQSQRAQLVTARVDKRRHQLDCEAKLEIEREEQRRKGIAAAKKARSAFEREKDTHSHPKAAESENYRREITETTGSITDIHGRVTQFTFTPEAPLSTAAEREQRSRLRTQLRQQWQEINATHQRLNQEYLDTEMDWEVLLTMPALRDVTDPYTQKMIQAFNRARRVPAEQPAWLRADTHVDTPLFDIHAEPYVQSVEQFDTALAAAKANARKIGLDLIPEREKNSLALIEKLLATARGGSTEGERQAAYGRIAEEIKRLTHVEIPQRARAAIEHRAAGMIEA